MVSSIRAIKTMSPLFFSIALLFVGNGLVVSSCGALLKNAGVSEFVIGLVNACFFVGAILSTIFSQNLIAKIGHIRAFGVFTAIFGVCAIAHNISPNLLVWAVLRAGLGFCYYGLLVVAESWMNERAKNAIRSRVIAFYECVFYVSFASGILILSLNLSTANIFIISATFILLSSIPLNLIRITPPKTTQKEPPSLPKIFSIVPLALVGAMIAGVLMNGFFTMAGVFVMMLGYGIAEVAYFMAFGMAGGFVSQIFLAQLSDRFGRRPAMMFACAVSFVASIWLLNVAEISQLYLAVFFLGAGVFCLYALSLARANDVLTQKSQSVKVARALLFSYSIGSLLSSVIMGVMMGMFGASGFIWIYIVLLAFLLVFAAFQKTVPMQYRTSYDASTLRTDAME